MKELVALTPTEMQTAQKGIINFCNQKRDVLQKELSEAQDNLASAKKNKWNSKPFANLVRRTARKIEYFDKLREAAKRGYLIIPNFPLDIFAVRTKRAHRKPTWKPMQKLPYGEGRYIDPDPFYREEEYQEDGKTKTRQVLTTLDEEISFPMEMVHPVVISATNAAMADKVFDQIGRTSKWSAGDPMIVGQICHPTIPYKVTSRP